MANWTVIPSTDTDADSPITEDLVTAMVDNSTYNHEHGVRGGTHTIPTRLAIARGYVTDTAAGTDTTWQVASVSFATDSRDGDPNFGDVPTVVVTAEESSASANDWGTAYEVYAHIREGTVTASGFDINWRIVGGDAGNMTIILHFIAVGEVTSGE